MQINRFLGNTENIQACYEKLFYSISIQFLTPYLIYQGYVRKIAIASF